MSQVSGGGGSHQSPPTLLRAVDSTVMKSLKQQSKEKRLVKKQAQMRNKEMDLSDLINKLEQVNAI